jgi:hypothetical protein
MKHEKILKRPDGSKVKVYVSLNIYNDGFNWSTGAFVCPAGKRKFEYNSTEGAATAEEIKEVQMELIGKIKP